MKIHNLLKTCSVLPALLVMPAMADRVVVSAGEVTDIANTTISGETYELSWKPAEEGGSVVFAKGDSATNRAVVNISDVTFAGNSAPKSYGGVLFADANSLLNISNSIFSGNSALGAASIYSASTEGDTNSGGVLVINKTQFLNNTGDSGGNVMLMAHDSSITNSKFIGNEAKYDAAALFIGSRGQAYLDNNEFIGNKANGTNGGAISVRASNSGSEVRDNSEAQLDILNSIFKDNYAKQNGGAIFNHAYSSKTDANAVYIFDTDFENNSAANGGAIYNNGIADANGKVGAIKVVDSDFEKNSATGNGGAIYNEGTMTIVNSDFGGDEAGAGNTAASGGAIYNTGTLTINGTADDYVEFEGNTASTEGGAIYSSGKLDINYARFENNASTNGDGGAIFVDTTNGEKTIIQNSEFIGNKAFMANDMDSGAITLRRGDVEIRNVTFKNNEADLGGALYSRRVYDKDVLIEDSWFEGNIADGAGALVNMASNRESGTSDTAGMTIKNTTFKNNIANGELDPDGSGAIFLGAESETVLDNVTFIGNESKKYMAGAIGMRGVEDGNNTKAKLDILNSTFTGNKAATQGGAIFSTFYNSDTNENSVSVYNTTFTGNTAAEGGAIYNAGDADRGGNLASMLLEDVTFTGNIATSKGGAIMIDGDGKVSLQGTNEFTGNIANKVKNDIHNLGTLDVVSGITTIDGGVTGTGTMNVASGATLDINTATVVQDNFDLSGTLAMSLMKSGRDNGTLYNGKLDVVNLTGNGNLKLNISSVGDYDIIDAESNTATFSSIDYGTIYTGSFDAANGVIKVTTKSVEDIAKDANLNTETATIVAGLANSDNATASLISLRAQEAIAKGESEYVETELAKTKPEGKPVAQSVAQSVQNQVVAVAAARMNPVVGRAGGDDEPRAAYGVWAQGLFNKSKMGSDFHGYTRGVAIGADALIDKVYTIGVGAAFNNSDVHADGGRHTDIDSTSLFVYGQYKPAEWFVNGTVSYTMSKYDETARSMGVLLSNDHDVDAFGAQLMAGYDFAVGMTPEIGVRYLHVNQDSYTNAMGAYVGDAKSNLLTGVAGLRYAFEIKNEDSEFKWMPELRAAATYDMVSDADVAAVTMPGGAAYVVGGDNLSRMGGEFGLGLTMQYRGLDVSLNYELDLHKDYTSQTGMLKFRYDF